MTLVFPWAVALALDPGKLPSQYVEHHWGTKDGLPQNSVYAITQTRNGYLWLGTQAGLARFDGSAFRVFDGRNTPALGNGFVRALLEDCRGTLWIGTNGDGLLMYRSRRFTRIALPGLRRDARVLALEQDRAGSIWVGTDQGLARRAGETWTVLAPGVLGTGVLSLAQARKNGMWIGTDDGLMRWDGTGLTRPSGALRLPGRRVTALLEDQHGMLWVGTNSGLYLFRKGTLVRRVEKDDLPDARIHTIFQEADGAIWIGTARGLVRILRGRLKGMPRSADLGNDQIMAVASDREGNLWVGTGSSGVVELVDGKLATFGKDEGLGDPRVRCVYEDRKGALWMGTDGGLYRLMKGKLAVWKAHSGGLLDDRITSILEDRRGRLWVGTYGGGLNVLASDGWHSYTTRNGLSNDVVTSLLEDSNEAIWVGTGHGLDRIAGDRVDVVTRQDGLPSDVVMFIHRAHDGRLWVGTYGGGLGVWDGSSWRIFTADDGLANNRVTCVHEDGNGVLWFGTLGGGLSWFAGNRFYSIGLRDGLPDGNIFAILEDNADVLWMSSQKGIFRVSKREIMAASQGRRGNVRAVLYGEADGMRSREGSGGSQPAGWKRRDGTLWFATIGGAVAVDPTAAKNPLPPPLVAIESVTVDGKNLLWTGNGLELPAGTRRIEVQYAGLSFYDPARVTFRYHMGGFDRQWVPAGTRRVASYTGLRPGRYRFRVVAVNPDGVASSQAAGVLLRLLPHFYQTSAFGLVVAVTAFLVAWGAYKWRVRWLHARLTHMSQLAEERRRTTERLDFLAHHDLLTGLPNRLWFSGRLTDQIEKAATTAATFFLLVLDLDGLKEINSAFGHEVGDGVLKRVASRLELFLGKENAPLARIGGDEFSAILEGWTSQHEAVHASQRVLELVARPFHVAGRVLRLTASLGIGRYPEDGDDADALLKSAGIALADAKKRGGNTIGLSTERMREDVSRRALLKNELRDAIPGGELELRFQPEKLVATGKIHIVEALLRWQHPRLGILQPEMFIRLAEETGLITPLGRWVLREACRARVCWQAKGREGGVVAVNLSACEFRSGDLVKLVGETLREVGLEPESLMLEVTETAAMWDIDETVTILRQLRDLGVRIAIDDFGTGYSSLTWLKRFPVQLLKIDQSFVRDMLTDPAALGIVEGVISIAHGLGLDVVAEGVEEAEQLDALRRAGCDLIQGFLVGHPMPLDELTRMIQGEGAGE